MGNKPHKEKEDSKKTQTPSPYDAEPQSKPMTPTEKEKEERRKRLRKMSVTTMFTDISKYYDMDHKEIGHGQYGIVRYLLAFIFRKAIERSSQRKVAVKSILKEKVNNLDNLRNEINILRVSTYLIFIFSHYITQILQNSQQYTKTSDIYIQLQNYAKVVNFSKEYYKNQNTQKKKQLH